MKPLSELVQKYKGGLQSIPYAALLNTTEWAFKRDAIVQRDNYKCQSCGESETVRGRDADGQFSHVWLDDYEYETTSTIIVEGLEEEYTESHYVCSISYAKKPYVMHVHHKYYVANRLPWMYPDSALLTLCNWCHEEVHKKQVIPFYIKVNGKLVDAKRIPCPRCHGAGGFPQYSHVDGGTCFTCQGGRYVG